jgi:hypothetical protein
MSCQPKPGELENEQTDLDAGVQACRPDLGGRFGTDKSVGQRRRRELGREMQ